MKPVQTPHRGRWVLIGLAVLSFSGVVGSYVMIQTGWLPQATKNYGELVQPARPIGDTTLRDLEGRPARFSDLKGKWLLMYFGAAECLKPCIDNLYKMRQVTAAQGREAYRVERVFVATDPMAMDLLRDMLADYPGMHVWRGAPAEVRAFAQQFALPGSTPLDGLHRLYVVDPLGNFMMSYPADADPRGINKDLKLLLRASHVG